MRSRLLQIALSRHRALSAPILLALILYVLPATASSQQLSIRHYGVSEGLANNRVVAIHQDAKGYVWFATYEGLSRFDGYHFTNYNTRDGLRHTLINDVTEDGNGHLWVATNGGGVSRLLDDPREAARLSPQESTTFGPKFVSFRLADSTAANRVNKLVFDAGNNLWCGTDEGIYRAAADSLATSAPRFERVLADMAQVGLGGAALLDHQGRIWFGVPDGLIEMVGEQILRYAGEPFARSGAIAMVEDSRGKLYAATDAEIFEFIAPPSASTRGGWRKLPLHLKPRNGIVTMITDQTGTLWVGTVRGLIKYQDGQQSLYATAQGLSVEWVLSLCQDRDGNLWIGTYDGGVCKLAGEMIASFTKAEGLVNDVHKIIEGRDGRIIASLYPGGLVQFREGKFVPIQNSQKPPFDGIGGRILQSRDGQWWIGTEKPGAMILRLRKSILSLQRSERLLSLGEIGESWISHLYEDPEGTIWVAAGSSLYRFDPARRGPPFYERVTLELPPIEQLQKPIPGHLTHTVRNMIGDHAGALWLGDMYLLAKYANGKVKVLEPTEGLPETDPRAFFIDHRGWLWIGLRYKGVSVTTDPTAEQPSFVNYSTQNGLASDTVWSITEDDLGRLYFGTGRGLDRLDPATGRMRHFTTADGLAGELVNYCMKDSRGYIWVATTTGISRLDPRAETVSNQAPPVYLSHVQIAGEDLPIPETGARVVTHSDLPASHNNLLIQYTSVDFHDAHQLRYQYELAGLDSDWSAPTDQKAVNFARLAPGAYRFLVRAINEDGVASLEPAVLEFRILPPVWQRWWFIIIIATLTGFLTYTLYRYRVARLVELERVRTRIAADLHDDIGSSLSQIAVLSEVLRTQLGTPEASVSKNLSLINRVSQEALGSMSDIVWAINPLQDHLSDLVRRMRRIAGEMLSARNIEFNFIVPTAGYDLRIGADIRREVYLMFKEAINNIIRHSQCTQAEIRLKIEGTWLALVVTDNGKGFNPDRVSEGNGVVSLRRRTRALGGEIEVSSSEGQGTTLAIKIPHRHHFRFRDRVGK